MSHTLIRHVTHMNQIVANSPKPTYIKVEGARVCASKRESAACARGCVCVVRVWRQTFPCVGVCECVCLYAITRTDRIFRAFYYQSAFCLDQYLHLLSGKRHPSLSLLLPSPHPHSTCVNVPSPNPWKACGHFAGRSRWSLSEMRHIGINAYAYVRMFVCVCHMHTLA